MTTNELLKLILDSIHAIPPETFVGTYGDFELVETIKDSCCEVAEKVCANSKEIELTYCRHCNKAEPFQGNYICSEYGGIWGENDGCTHGEHQPEPSKEAQS